MTIPRLRTVDSTRAFFREGYRFVGNRCAELDTDAFATRIMLRQVVCMMGEDAARQFYDGHHFTRMGAMPTTTLRQLQDKGSVQSLDGAAHAARKALFLDLLTGSEVTQIGDLFATRLTAAFKRWRNTGPIVLHDAIAEVLCDAACAWAGVPVAGETLAARTREMTAMIDGAGTAGPRAWRGLMLRRRSERWARRAIADIRGRDAAGPATSPIERLARFHDHNGKPLDLTSAGVEVLNLIRPTVAVARFITFAALALHEHVNAAAWLKHDLDGRLPAFVSEVRRFYPFFPVIGGRVRQAFVWRDRRFEQGDWALLGLHATNHDPRLWVAPEQFRPERFVGRASSGFDLVSQGAGDHARDHRCPGEWFTIELIGCAIRQLLTQRYIVPEQSLAVPLSRFPTLPCSGFVVQSY
jgi:fatty-acid peroxygenase